MKTLIRIIKYGKKWSWAFALTLFSITILTLLSLVLPIAVRELLNILTDIQTYDELPFEIWVIIGTLLAVYLAKLIFQVLNHYFSRYFSYKTLGAIRCHIYSHLQKLSPKFFHNKQIGQISQRVMEDVGSVPNLLAWSLPEFLVGTITIIGVITIMFVINPILAAFVVAPLPVLLFIAIFQRKMAKHWDKVRKLLGGMYGMLSDNLQGMKEIQSFGKQEYEQNKFSELTEEIHKNSLYATRWGATLRPLMELMQGIGTVLLVVVGAYLAMNGIIEDVGDIVAFLMYIGILYVPVAGIARVVEDATNVITNLKRTFEYLDYESDVVEKPDAITVGQLKGDVEFKNVTFGYNDVKVLSEISFKANAGQMIALVGETGAGKTTIAALISRFYDVNEGAITIDGIDIRDMTLESLRNNISIVLQDVFLFNGTIFENIAYGSATTPTEEEIIAVAKFACIHDFIDSLADKYQTRIGERGVRLSGGQKQRLAIARALLRNAPILLLDEATSSIDNTTEKEIQQAIEKLSQDKSKTIVVIAHRLSTIEKADKILYIKDTKIVEEGSHKQLIKKNGAYAKLRQSK
ncbi:MAG: ABC transporter ATP-binding protein/permease [Firmicutes bacterium]|nr:ABC transporter ATP-binding protein/permease [Bacillota bacterium]MCL2770993.1 ABC transporter ATP-binding protein/permease [Bacillota bacterium]